MKDFFLALMGILIVIVFLAMGTIITNMKLDPQITWSNVFSVMSFRDLAFSTPGKMFIFLGIIAIGGGLVSGYLTWRTNKGNSK